MGTFCFSKVPGLLQVVVEGHFNGRAKYHLGESIRIIQLEVDAGGARSSRMSPK